MTRLEKTWYKEAWATLREKCCKPHQEAFGQVESNAGCSLES